MEMFDTFFARLFDLEIMLYSFIGGLVFIIYWFSTSEIDPAFSGKKEED